MNKTLIIVLAVLGAILLIGGLGYISYKNPLKPALKPTAPFITTTDGWSMLGAKYNNNIHLKNPTHFEALIDPTVPFKDLKVGDVIEFKNNNAHNYTFHKIVEIKGDSVRTTGTGNLLTDGWIKEDMYVGVAIGVRDVGEKEFKLIR